MTPNDFLSTFCRLAGTTQPQWQPLYDDVAHGRRAANTALDCDSEMAAYRGLAGEARSARAAWLLDVLRNTPDPDVVDLAEVSAEELAALCADDLLVDESAPLPTLHLSEVEIEDALVRGEDPRAINLATATYDSPCQACADDLLATAQICARYGDQAAVDKLLRTGAATVLLCDRAEDVTPVSQALLRFRACGVPNDFEAPRPVSPPTVVDLDRDPQGLKCKRALQALSQKAPLVIITSEPERLAGVLAHLPIVRIAAPSADAVLAVIRDVCSATGCMSTDVVRDALPSQAELQLLPRTALLLALR